MTTVQESVGDIHGLHSKLDRKATVERTNMNATSQFQQDFHFEMTAMEEDLQGFVDSHRQSYSIFSNNIGELVDVRSQIIFTRQSLL